VLNALRQRDRARLDHTKIAYRLPFGTTPLQSSHYFVDILQLCHSDHLSSSSSPLHLPGSSLSVEVDGQSVGIQIVVQACPSFILQLRFLSLILKDARAPSLAASGFPISISRSPSTTIIVRQQQHREILQSADIGGRETEEGFATLFQSSEVRHFLTSSLFL
jgi:hypothetical protein